jgi:hypothetical protein
MNPRRRREVFETAVRTTTELLAELETEAGDSG